MPTIPGGDKKKNMRILQLNLNHCAVAQDLLWQTKVELGLDVVIIAEQYKNVVSHGWTTDSTSKAAIWWLGENNPQSKMAALEPGFTWIKVGGIYIFSCYAPPSLSIDDYERMLAALVREASGKHPLLIAGDFNAWSTTWGSLRTNKRGKILLESLAHLNLNLLNEPGKITFDKGRCNSVIDLAFAHSEIERRTLWSISDVYTHSDHHAIFIHIATNRQCQRVRKAQQRGWRKQKFDEEAFNFVWDEAVLQQMSASDMSVRVTAEISKACDASMPRRYNIPSKLPAYWWNEEVSEARKNCLRARRKAKRARNRPSWNTMLAIYRESKSVFKAVVKRSKRACFVELRDSANSDPWGRAYKTVMKAVRGPRAPQPTCPLLMREVVATLFPPQMTLAPRTWSSQIPSPEVSVDEVLMTLSRIDDNKAPGLDGIPNAALKSAVKRRPGIFAKLFDTCLKEGVFPKTWKKQKLVLLLKPGKPPDQPTSYRPLCMLDTMGKMLERIVCDRLQEYLEAQDGLSQFQFGFRKARSTVDAILTVMSIARQATSGTRWKHGRKKYCALITLDIKNAFNSANWQLIMRCLETYKVPDYLQRVIADYFKDRLLLYDTEKGVMDYKVTGGVPQGSVLGPTLWNAMYDGILKLDLPAETTLVGYADDIAIVAVDKMLDSLQAKCNDAISRIRKWLIAAKLELAAQKTEAVLLSRRSVQEDLVITVGEHHIKTQPYLKYLGVQIDSKMTFKDHLREIGNKAERVHGALMRLMPNIGGPSESKRRLLSTVTTSVISYAAPIWADAKQVHLKQVRVTHRLSALRVGSAYRTVSDDAICVISSKIPIELYVKELQRLYSTAGERPSENKRRAERQRTMSEWQKLWEQSTKGRWTFHIIPVISKWYERRHGEVNYNVTQLLSGHGCFKQYLYRFHIEEDPFCPVCPDELEDARHVLFYCPRFNEDRDELERTFGVLPTTQNLVENMCESTKKWNAVCAVAKRIMEALRKAEIARRTEQRRQRELLQAQYEFPQATPNSSANVARQNFNRLSD